ncbi:hypothetical protein [Natrarchaeobius oligotrophus]|uniref:Uncharacterized protein n=1 Tax=Natrarchaeobius chitinivorans TaxID=1679083 RepID=A0A3N6M6Z4_NATCH|nr:hypothetical protein [Natrarchaeobius chitinivorans]RQG99378.1 hypothetical protein EA472_14215 [Natrarchaeobius chitinivorans]
MGRLESLDVGTRAQLQGRPTIRDGLLRGGRRSSRRLRTRRAVSDLAGMIDEGEAAAAREWRESFERVDAITVETY